MIIIIHDHTAVNVNVVVLSFRNRLQYIYSVHICIHSLRLSSLISLVKRAIIPAPKIKVLPIFMNEIRSNANLHVVCRCMRMMLFLCSGICNLGLSGVPWYSDSLGQVRRGAK